MEMINFITFKSNDFAGLFFWVFLFWFFFLTLPTSAFLGKICFVCDVCDAYRTISSLLEVVLFYP